MLLLSTFSDSDAQLPYTYVAETVLLCLCFITAHVLWIDCVLSSGVVICVAGRCRPPPWVENAVASLNQTERTVNITCLPGHRFPDGSRSRVYQCDADGDWQHIPQCDGWFNWLIDWKYHRCCLMSTNTNILKLFTKCESQTAVQSPRHDSCSLATLLLLVI